MKLTIEELCKRFDLGVDQIRHRSKNFCELLGITTFAYVRVYPNQRISWLTSNPDQDRFLIESGALKEDPLVNTPEVLQEGHYLYFNDRQFPGSENFYRDRARLFQMDHGMVIVKHQKDYLETCCFSGLLAKHPLYNLFLNEKDLFTTFMEHFTQQLDPRLLALLEEGVAMSDLKDPCGKEKVKILEDRHSLITACGWKNLLKLSKREKETLLLFKQGFTYQEIGRHLKLSARTIEHYINSVKNKLNLETRAELYLAAEKLCSLFGVR